MMRYTEKLGVSLRRFFNIAEKRVKYQQFCLFPRAIAGFALSPVEGTEPNLPQHTVTELPQYDNCQYR